MRLQTCAAFVSLVSCLARVGVLQSVELALHIRQLDDLADLAQSVDHIRRRVGRREHE
jgi:hypothetical protein